MYQSLYIFFVFFVDAFFIYSLSCFLPSFILFQFPFVILCIFLIPSTCFLVSFHLSSAPPISPPLSFPPYHPLLRFSRGLKAFHFTPFIRNYSYLSQSVFSPSYPLSLPSSSSSSCSVWLFSSSSSSFSILLAKTEQASRNTLHAAEIPRATSPSQLSRLGLGEGFGDEGTAVERHEWLMGVVVDGSGSGVGGSWIWVY